MRSSMWFTCLTIVAFSLFTHGTAAGQTPAFEADFDDRTMRVDYFHTGSSSEELFGLDRVVSDGAWSGSKTRLVDGTNMGKYLFEVRDLATDRLMYSRGFASIYGEWETTGEAREVHRTFHESLRFPWPLRPVRVTRPAPAHGRSDGPVVGARATWPC